MPSNVIHLPLTQDRPFDLFDGRFFEHPLVSFFTEDGKPNPFLPVWVWMLVRASEETGASLTLSESVIYKNWGFSPQSVEDWLAGLDDADLISRSWESASVTINALVDHLFEQSRG